MCPIKGDTVAAAAAPVVCSENVYKSSILKKKKSRIYFFIEIKPMTSYFIVHVTSNDNTRFWHKNFISFSIRTGDYTALSHHFTTMFRT